MADKCPICGRVLGTWTKDPILCTPSLSTDQYKGYQFITLSMITELQDKRKEEEAEYFAEGDRTTFSDINASGAFQCLCTYITELRESTEKILTKVGMDKSSYFGLDEDGLPLATPKSDWTDPQLEADKFQIKAIHIEDLRHFINTVWIETWDTARETDGGSILDTLSLRDPGQTIFMVPPYNVTGKTYTHPSKTIKADFDWSVGQTLTINDLYNFRYVHVDVDTLWNISGGDNKIINYNGRLYNRYNMNHNPDDSYLTVEYITSTKKYPCLEFSKLDVINWNSNITADHGVGIVLIESWYDYGLWDPEDERFGRPLIEAAMDAMSIGGTVEVRLYFDTNTFYATPKWSFGTPAGWNYYNNFYISFYKSGGQHIVAPTWSVSYSSPTYLYQVAYDMFPQENHGMDTNPISRPSIETFKTWRIKQVQINVRGNSSTATIWKYGWMYNTLACYSEYAETSVDFSIDDIKLYSSRP